ncbi:hypothetical protein JOD54_001805 [Actinokineospora baliensis]|uniref:DUF3027 domain-containing protein n=1 Tax=Actinokineospora baliensis TaxID=547056 RepID=UPI00195EA76D|nr:DUF3027 domain-containing protein [Actinokineospora baliensis]MBM7771601.1 hypothetical protein [Actinokineospora baliensis]
MTSTPAPEAVTDPALLAAVEFARAAAREQAGSEVGAHVAVRAEDSASATHLFEADKPGYRGWRWAVTVAAATSGDEVTVSEVVLLPGPDALVAPAWIPWQDRVRAGDLGVGDLLPVDPDDPRLVPAYVESDDPEVEALAMEVGLGRVRVLSRFGRVDAADRWKVGEFGPGSDMARGAPAACGTCGFYLPVAGSLGAAFGVCGNEISPADGRAVHAGYGCGAHSENEVEQISPVLVADLIYDDARLDIEVTPVAEEPAGEPETDEPAADEAQASVDEPPAVEQPSPESVEQAVDAVAQGEQVAEPSGQPESDSRG